jgi:mono/diheme cytochrome c family protein
MKSVYLIVSAIAVLATAYTTVIAGQGTTKTSWDGVYTADQASKGEDLYTDKCTKCHGPEGTGGDAPDLVGGGFASDWDGTPLTDVFDKTRIYMPQDNPESLSREQVASITAFLLRLNGFPAGTSELPTTAQDLASIKYVAVKPSDQK